MQHCMQTPASPCHTTAAPWLPCSNCRLLASMQVVEIAWPVAVGLD